ncbi:MAG TPA: ATP-binding protein [Vicinamibacterales bacterium]|nr:ATP-binding protein [Vicinamibacterales bacterium]
MNRWRGPTQWPQRVSSAGATLSVIVGAATLAGWWFGVPQLMQPLPWLPGVAPSTAARSILLGTSILLARRSLISNTRRGAASLCAAIVLLTAAATLIEYIWNRQPWRFTDGSAPSSAAAFAMLGAALLLIDVAPAVRADLSEVLAVSAASTVLVTITGYVYGATTLYESNQRQIGLAPQTAAVVLLLSAAVLCLRPDRPLIGLVASVRAGGFAVRRLLLGVPAILTLGLIVTLGFRRSLYAEPFAAALLAVAAIAVAVGLAFSTARALNRLDELRSVSEQALADREERLRDLIEQASDGIFVLDLNGRYLDVNDAACRMVGRRREDLVGRLVFDIVPLEDIPRVNADRDVLLSGGTVLDEWIIKRPDGTKLPVEVSAKILPDGRCQALVRDISRRKEVERASEAVVEAVSSTPQSSVLAVLQTIALEAQLVADAEYVALGLNGTADRPFEPWVFAGMTAEQAARIGRFPRAVGLLGAVSAEDGIVRVADIRRHPMFRGLPPHHPPITSFLGVPIRHHGKPIGNLFLANKRGAPEFTIADERAVERLATNAGASIETARLYQAEGLERAWLQAMVDQMPEGVILVDAAGTTRIESQSMLPFMRDTGERDRFGQPVKYDLFTASGHSVPLNDQPHTRALNGVTTLRQELLLRHWSGRMVPMLVSAAPVFATTGQQSGAVTIFQDISTLKELERLRKEWASVVAHDLRQPLGMITLDAEALARMLDEGDVEKFRKTLDRIQRSTRHMNKMIGDLADVSRIEAHRLDLELAETDLAIWIDDVIDRLSLLAKGHPIRISKTLKSAVAVVDTGRIEQVVSNLISNAVKYGETGAEIGIRLSQTDSEFEFAVSNHGPGIPAEELPQLFERFSRSETSRQVPGLGLGLYIARGLVNAHGGQIWAESIPGETTTFFFTIPSLPNVTPSKEHADTVPV